MTTAAAFSVANRLAEVLHHLGIESAHFAVSVVTYITGFPQAHPERIASLTLSVHLYAQVNKKTW